MRPDRACEGKDFSAVTEPGQAQKETWSVYGRLYVIRPPGRAGQRPQVSREYAPSAPCLCVRREDRSPDGGGYQHEEHQNDEDGRILWA